MTSQPPTPSVRETGDCRSSRSCRYPLEVHCQLSTPHPRGLMLEPRGLSATVRREGAPQRLGHAQTGIQWLEFPRHSGHQW